MQSFNKVTCQKLRSDLNALLAKYGAENNLTFDLGNMRFNSDEVKITSFVARVVGAKKATEKALDHQFAIHGLKNTNDRGDTMLEYNNRRYQYPFIYMCKRDGKRYKCSLAQALRLGFGVKADLVH